MFTATGPAIITQECRWADPTGVQHNWRSLIVARGRLDLSRDFLATAVITTVSLELFASSVYRPMIPHHRVGGPRALQCLVRKPVARQLAVSSSEWLHPLCPCETKNCAMAFPFCNRPVNCSCWISGFHAPPWISRTCPVAAEHTPGCRGRSRP